jgi:hypothetical protein
MPASLRRVWRLFCIGRRDAAVSRSRPSGQLGEELTRPLSSMTGNVSLAIRARVFRAEAASTGSVPGIVAVGSYRRPRPQARGWIATTHDWVHRKPKSSRAIRATAHRCPARH